MRGLQPSVPLAENMPPCCMPKPILSWNNQYNKEIKLNFTCSLVNHRASSISFLSTLISVDTATAKQPIIKEEGIGHGWQETYWTWPTLTPLSSSTSLRTASSIVSPNQMRQKNKWCQHDLGTVSSKQFKHFEITLERAPVQWMLILEWKPRSVLHLQVCGHNARIKMSRATFIS